MSLIFVDSNGTVQGDVDELGRRLRSLYQALSARSMGSHAECVEAYERAMQDVYPAESHEQEGTWAWWAAKICRDPTQHD